VVELPFLKQMASPVLSAGSQTVRPAQRRNFDAGPYLIVSGQHIAGQRGGRFRQSVAVDRRSDENTTQNDEITTHHEGSVSKDGVKSRPAFNRNRAWSST
jgi:hypothetical protein